MKDAITHSRVIGEGAYRTCRVGLICRIGLIGRICRIAWSSERTSGAPIHA
jgi:hypothetical protein